MVQAEDVTDIVRNCASFAKKSILYGPQETTGLIRFQIAMLLWWKLYLVAAIALFFLYVAHQGPPLGFSESMWAFILGIVASDILDLISN